MKKTICVECNIPYETDRDDSHFCTPRCKAAYYRSHGDVKAHADLERMKSKFCERCGNMFWYNDYAERGGERVATYCSGKCRVAAFRARKAAEMARNKRAQDNPQGWEHYAEHEKKWQNEHAQQKQKEPPKQKQQTDDTEWVRNPRDWRETATFPRRATATECYRWLGVPHEANQTYCKKAMRDWNKKLHPDANNGQNSEALKGINAAFDWLKRNVWK